MCLYFNCYGWKMHWATERESTVRKIYVYNFLVGCVFYLKTRNWVRISTNILHALHSLTESIKAEWERKIKHTHTHTHPLSKLVITRERMRAGGREERHAIEMGRGEKKWRECEHWACTYWNVSQALKDCLVRLHTNTHTHMHRSKNRSFAASFRLFSFTCSHSLSLFLCMYVCVLC